VVVLLIWIISNLVWIIYVHSPNGCIVASMAGDELLVGDYGFDPFGLGKPAEYLQFDLDSLDQNLAKNLAGDVIGTRFEGADVKSTPFQPYTEVFGLQRFRECELIHGRWAMLATLGALTVEWLTGVTWQDAGKVRNTQSL
jgi:light-harvesting complex II chlorophyll a/b binding protein 4